MFREIHAINNLIFCFRAIVGFTNKHRIVGISAKNQVSWKEKTLSQFQSLDCFQWKLSDMSWYDFSIFYTAGCWFLFNVIQLCSMSVYQYHGENQ